MKKILELLNKAKNFLNEVKVEVKKVTWPNRDSLTTYTVVVLFVVIIVSAYIGVIDRIMGVFLNLFLKI